MPTIDFFVLEESSRQKALFFVCQLLEKTHQKQQKVFVYTESKEEAERLDLLLWIYRDDSFLPHNLYQTDDDFPPLIQIGSIPPTANQHEVLVNLTSSLPAFYQSFKQVIEIVFSDPHVQQLARERFRQYREQGFELKTYKIAK